MEPAVSAHSKRILTPIACLIILALESQVFSVDQPSNFYTLYGNPGGVVASEAAQDRFEEDVVLTSRAVSTAFCADFR